MFHLEVNHYIGYTMLSFRHRVGGTGAPSINRKTPNFFTKSSLTLLGKLLQTFTYTLNRRWKKKYFQDRIAKPKMKLEEDKSGKNVIDSPEQNNKRNLQGLSLDVDKIRTITKSHGKFLNLISSNEKPIFKRININSIFHVIFQFKYFNYLGFIQSKLNQS